MSTGPCADWQPQSRGKEDKLWLSKCAQTRTSEGVYLEHQHSAPVSPRLSKLSWLRWLLYRAPLPRTLNIIELRLKSNPSETDYLWSAAVSTCYRPSINTTRDVFICLFYDSITVNNLAVETPLSSLQALAGIARARPVANSAVVRSTH